MKEASITSNSALSQANPTVISHKGKALEAPSLEIAGQPVVITGKWPKIATIKEEDWLEGELVKDPEFFIRALKSSPLKPDIFAFSQKLYDTTPKYSHPFEWDNQAVISITSFDDWWEKRVSRKLRQDVAKAKKMGLDVREVEYTDEVVRGIKGIYDETPIRQGRPFWHYGKDFETVKRENSTFPERSQCIAAYWQGEMIGFLKLVYVDDIARLIQIISKLQHNDKRVLNALIAKAVELAEKRGCLYLTYARYTYDKKKNSSIIDFKHRNGFVEVIFPRYYVPLTWKGWLAMKIGLHLGYKNLIPSFVADLLIYVRSKILERKYPMAAAEKTAGSSDGQNASQAKE